jgi:hypothetical protein
MNMVRPRLTLRLLLRADSSAPHEALIGDVLEEIAGGRSRWWLYQQLIGLYGLAITTQARHHARLTPCVVAFALGVALLGGVSIASVNSVLEAWLGLYLVAGTLSLLAHMVARAQVHVRL